MAAPWKNPLSCHLPFLLKIIEHTRSMSTSLYLKGKQIVIA
jgi:hypothetical protein